MNILEMLEVLDEVISDTLHQGFNEDFSMPLDTEDSIVGGVFMSAEEQGFITVNPKA